MALPGSVDVPVHLSFDASSLGDIRRQAKRVERKASGLAREIGKLEELCASHGISIEVESTQEQTPERDRTTES